MTGENLDFYIADYQELFATATPSPASIASLRSALLTQGIVGMRGVPKYREHVQAFIAAALEFAGLPSSIKAKYAPVRDAGDGLGYEIGAEQFQDSYGTWQIDDKKASYYAAIPEIPANKWPLELDLRKPYLELASSMFETIKKIIHLLGICATSGLDTKDCYGWGRMLHYHKEGELTNANPLWCGSHVDHSVLTALIPSFYFQNGQAIEEPEEAGLYVLPNTQKEFVKIPNTDKNLMLFQVGEFGQLMANDEIKATRHLVKKALGSVERYTLALFFNAANESRIQSKSVLTLDERYLKNKFADGSISYGAWHEASLDRYRARSGSY